MYNNKGLGIMFYTIHCWVTNGGLLLYVTVLNLSESACSAETLDEGTAYGMSKVNP